MQSRTEVHVCDKPAYVNFARIVPTAMRPDQFGLMEDFDYLACLTVFADRYTRWSEVLAAANAALDSEPGVRGGASLLSRGGCVVRFLARSAPDLTRTSKKLCDAARKYVLGLPPFDYRKY